MTHPSFPIALLTIGIAAITALAGRRQRNILIAAGLLTIIGVFLLRLVILETAAWYFVV